MRKYLWITVLALIASTVYFTSCERGQEMLDTIMPDAEQVEPPPEMVETPSEPEVVVESASTKLAVAASAELKDPNNDGGDEWVNLERYAPDLLPTLSSTEVFGAPADLETTVIFVNCTETETSFYWLDHQRNEVFYGKIAPGEACWQHSWEGHVWIVKDAAENTIALFVAQDETGRALLMDPSTPAPESPPEMVETPPETPPMVETEPAETTDLHGGMVSIEDAMSTVGLRKVYWITGETGTDQNIIRGNPDGSGQEIIVPAQPGTNSSAVKNFVVDSESGKLYWCSDWGGSDGGLWRVNLDGTNIEKLVTTPIVSFSLDLEAGKIYWATDDRSHLFHRSNLDGSGVEKFKTHTIAALIEGVHGIAFHPIDRQIYVMGDRNMYVINADDLDIKLADMELEWHIGQYGYQKKSVTLDIDDRKIYWVISGGNSSGIYRVNLDGTNYGKVVDTYDIAGTSDVTATFDFNTRKVYWIPNRHSRLIVWQTNLDGSGSEGLFALPHSLSHIAVETGPIN